MSFYPPAHDDALVINLPFKRTVGHECEYASGAELAGWLFSRQYAPSERLHGYQCRCDERDDFPIHPTSDGTAAGGEYIIGGGSGVLFGSQTYIEAVRILAEGVAECRNEISEGVGMHTHVGTSDLNTGDKITLLRNYLVYQDQLLILAAGAFREVRNNGCTAATLNAGHYATTASWWTTNPDQLRVQLPGRPTLNFGEGGSRHTVEFRVWNSARSAWRMVLAAAISAAMVQAAKERRYANNENPGDLTHFLSGLLTPDTLTLVDRQRKFQANYAR